MLKNSGIMAVVGAHGTPSEPRAIRTPTPYLNVAPPTNFDQDCHVCGFHVCDCAPKPGFEHWGRRRLAGTYRVYLRSDRRASVLRREGGWTPAWGLGASANEHKGPPLPLLDAMRLADEKQPMVKTMPMDEYRKALGYRDEHIQAHQAEFRRHDVTFNPPEVSYLSPTRHTAPAGWSKLPVEGGFEGWQKGGVTLVHRPDINRDVYFSCGVELHASSHNDAAGQALRMHGRRK